MAIDRVRRRIVTREPTVSGTGPATSLVRSLVAVALAAIAILVLLPAALAAQATSAT